MTDQETITFPLDWKHWRYQWTNWKNTFSDKLGQSDHRFPAEPNPMADEVLGAWEIAGRDVELSEVRFMNRRFVGITYGDGGTALVESFDELEAELGIS